MNVGGTMDLTGLEALSAADRLRKLCVNEATLETLYWQQSPSELWVLSYPGAARGLRGTPRLARVEDEHLLGTALQHLGWEAFDPNSVVEWLIDRWCERRAVIPLGKILRAWPHFGLTDGYGALRDALAGLRGPGFPQVEAELVHLAQNSIERMLRRG